VTRPDPLDARGVVTGVWSCVVAVADRVLAAVVVGAVVAAVDAVLAVVAAELVPEKEWAATAEKAPVRTRPPAMVPLVRFDSRRRPASRRATGSVSMATILAFGPRRLLGNGWEDAQSFNLREPVVGRSEEVLRFR
jgi:hypothetical protein